MARASFPIGGYAVRAGARREIGLPIARLVTGAEVTLPVLVVHGRHEGPVVWIDAAIHGDEVVGVEVIRRVLAELDPKRLSGTVLAVPIVNVHGFMNGDRYLPDRRDLNRSFPGSPRGSLAGRIAHLMMTEIITKCEVGIDLHTGADHRTNLPQIRADLDDPATADLAGVFGAPLVYHARLRDGSLRQAGADVGAKVLVYEAGEAGRFDDWAIEPGVDGVLRVLAHLGMTEQVAAVADAPPRPLECRASRWVRAGRTGILRIECELGDRVAEGERLGVISDSFGHSLRVVRSPGAGVVIGRSTSPLVNQGDAVVHVGAISATDLDD
jgi:predicted deacylase